MLAATAITAPVARAARADAPNHRPHHAAVSQSSRTPSPISPATLAAQGGHRTPNPAPPSTLPVGAASMAFQPGWPSEHVAGQSRSSQVLRSYAGCMAPGELDSARLRRDLSLLLRRRITALCRHRRGRMHRGALGRRGNHRPGSRDAAGNPAGSGRSDHRAEPAATGDSAAGRQPAELLRPGAGAPGGSGGPRSRTPADPDSGTRSALLGEQLREPRRVEVAAAEDRHGARCRVPRRPSRHRRALPAPSATTFTSVAMRATVLRSVASGTSSPLAHERRQGVRTSPDRRAPRSRRRSFAA